ncbi:MAG TPA: DUF6159 family protein [Mycobacteriales bacterium]
MGRFQVGWQLGLRSWRLLRADKELVALPIASGLATLIMLGVLGLPGLLLQRDAGHATTGSVVLYAVALLAIAFVGTFFSAALVAGALQRLDGGDPTITSALRAAWQRKAQIAQWALVSTVVGLVINLIESRGGVLGRVGGWFLDVAWAVATAFALPVIIVEGTGPFDSLKRSSSIIKARWGDAVGTYAGASILFLPAYLVALVVGFVLIAVSPALGIAVLVSAFLLLSVLAACVSAIARAALYQYATTGQSPLIDPALASAAFQPRGRGMGGVGMGGVGGFSGRGF